MDIMLDIPRLGNDYPADTMAWINERKAKAELLIKNYEITNKDSRFNNDSLGSFEIKINNLYPYFLEDVKDDVFNEEINYIIKTEIDNEDIDDWEFYQSTEFRNNKVILYISY